MTNSNLKNNSFNNFNNWTDSLHKKTIMELTMRLFINNWMSSKKEQVKVSHHKISRRESKKEKTESTNYINWWVLWSIFLETAMMRKNSLGKVMTKLKKIKNSKELQKKLSYPTIFNKKIQKLWLVITLTTFLITLQVREKFLNQLSQWINKITIKKRMMIITLLLKSSQLKMTSGF